MNSRKVAVIFVEQITKADRLTPGTRFMKSKNYYRSKQNKSKPAPSYCGLVPPFYPLDFFLTRIKKLVYIVFVGNGQA